MREPLERLKRLQDRRATVSAAWNTFKRFPIICGAALLAHEGYRWLQTGSWEPYTMLTLGLIPPGQTWVYAPMSWLGVHKVVWWILNRPAFIVLPLAADVIAAILFGIVAIGVHNQIEEVQKYVSDKAVGN
jgi:hypothetical protein